MAARRQVLLYKLVCANSEDSNQSTHPHNLISLGFRPEETVDFRLPIEGLLNTLIRLRGFAG